MSSLETGATAGLTVAQVVRLTGVKRSTLRLWEREFREFLVDSCDANGQRQFKPDSLQKIEQIKQLVEEHNLTLGGIRSCLQQATTEEERSPPDEKDVRARRLTDLVTKTIVRRLLDESRKSE